MFAAVFLDFLVNSSDVDGVVAFLFCVEYSVDGQIEGGNQILQLVPCALAPNKPNHKVAFM